MARSALAGAVSRHRPATSARSGAHGEWIGRAGRAGHVAKGVSYALIALLALQVAFGERRAPRDRQGVLREVASKPLGTAALVALAVGFGGYALWQLARAAFDRSHEGGGAKGLAKRAEHAVIGAVYVVSAVAAAALAAGSRSPASGDERAETARVLDWPGGRWLVGAVAVAFVVYGVLNVVKAKTQSFRDDLRDDELSPGARRWVVRSGVVGHAARGVVFVVVGVFLGKAAIEYDASEAVGIDGALAKLASRAYGTWLLVAVALGLLAYAVFCLVQARYRRV